MSDLFTQAGQYLSVSTPFGEDVLRLAQFSGREAMSELFQFQLTMQANDANLDPARIIGVPVTVTLSQGTAPIRYFNGVVTRFLHAGCNRNGENRDATYLADMAPRAYLLTLGTDRLIYQDQSVVDIVKQVLRAGGITFEDKLTGTYPVRDYCVCYDEAPFAFISRLMEEEGIFYFFTYTQNAHTMVLADSPSAHQPLAQTDALTFAPEDVPVPPINALTQFDLVNTLVIQRVMLNDYDYQASATALGAETSHSGGRGSRYVYPGRHRSVTDGTRLARIHLDAQQAGSLTAQGASRYHAMRAGGRFTVAGHPRDALNTAHVLRAVTHHATDRAYSNAFESFDAITIFRAPLRTPRPRVFGVHTAIVVGPHGEEIWSDTLGRVKVQFHWDQHGKHDETSSCWIRVAQTVAGQGWGHLFLPRIGQEVLVSYIDGDPDRPLITGSVYNDTQSPPVTLPGAQTQSVIRTRSSKNGNAGNEIRLEDKHESEQFFMHAQKDMQVDIENDLATLLVAGNETRILKKGNRTTTLETGNDTLRVKGTREVAVTGAEIRTNHANLDHAVEGNMTLTISGNLTIDVKGAVALRSGTTFSTIAGTALTATAGTSAPHKAGTTMTNEAPTIESKAGAAQTVDGGGLLTLRGGLVSIN
ncbi:type VI secretion system Vgr family protein [Robbsia andropogonis]|uniref:type VI secretion system Vgr family protein n=1 Tax=Robbsia andropogonis TaxID=28092 RepID=UPI002A6AC3A7|nr:type VI secretion system tip protein TssI/VgrG [Robbsia andropogonis]